MKIKFGAGILEARGKLGGMVFSRNTYGPYARSLAVPVNPSSQRQQQARSNLSSVVERWRATLTDAQRAAWNQYAAAITVVDKLGNAINLTGFNHYCRSNAAILAAGGDVVDTGPTSLSLPGADGMFTCTVDQTNQQISVAFDDSLDWLDEDGGFLSVSMSKPKGEGISFVGGPYRFADAIVGDSTTAPTTPATMAVPFAVATGQIVTCRGRIIRADGRVSAPFLHTTIVVVGS